MWSVFLVFLSYLDRDFVKGEFLNYALDTEKENKEMFSMVNGTFCAKMSVIGENYLYQESDGIEEVRSVHNPAGKLVDCSVIVNQMQVKSFMHLCRLRLKNQKTKLDVEMHFAHVRESKSACQEFNRRSERTSTAKRMGPTVNQLEDDERDSSDSEDHILKRSKRGFTYPGTLWCGAGNMADHYDHLGKFAETDSCCRVHDHCPYVIHAFSSKYGYTNFKWHSLCHCDCDNALKACLRRVNDTSSRVVGQAFFNVMEVPCFEFAYEDQCVERHWYGVCKRYERLPSAVIRESIPYDFGGVDVIDVLTVAPPREKYSEKGNKQEKPESMTQSTVSGSQTSGPEEPTLRNVVTAAEDFIKVLATVSTSQSSNADTAKGETQTSEKKKRKNTGKKKKTSKTRKEKGKGRKRKQKVATGTKVEEGATVTPSGSKAEEVIGKGNFISETGKNELLSRHADSFIESTFDLGGKDQPSNDVMKDEPMMEETADVSTISPTAVKKEQVVQHIQALTECTEMVLPSTPASTTPLTPPKTKKKEKSRKGEGRRRKSNITSSPTEVLLNITLKQKSLVDTTDNLSDISARTTIRPTIIPTGQLEPQKLKSHTEKGPVAAIATTPIAIPKTKRHRSRERGEGEERKTRRKMAPFVAVALENSTVENLKVITSTGAPTITLIPVHEPIERQVLHRPDIYEARASVPTVAVTSVFRVLLTKRQRSKEKRWGKRGRRGKVALPFSSESLLHNTSEVVGQSLTSSGGISLLNVPSTTTVISRPIGQLVLEEVENISEKGLATTDTGIPVVTTKRLRPKGREKRKRRKKIMPSVVNDGVTIQSNAKTVCEAMTGFSKQFTGHATLTVPSKADKTGEFNTPESTKQAFYSTSTITTTTRTPVMSPIQLSIQRAKEQFDRKRRRKMALSIRPQ